MSNTSQQQVIRHWSFHVHHPHPSTTAAVSLHSTFHLGCAFVWHLSWFCFVHSLIQHSCAETQWGRCTAEPLYSLVNVSKYYYSFSFSPSHSNGSRKYCGFNLTVEKSGNSAVRRLSEWQRGFTTFSLIFVFLVSSGIHRQSHNKWM